MEVVTHFQGSPPGTLTVGAELVSLTTDATEVGGHLGETEFLRAHRLLPCGLESLRVGTPIVLVVVGVVTEVPVPGGAARRTEEDKESLCVTGLFTVLEGRVPGCRPVSGSSSPGPTLLPLPPVPGDSYRGLDPRVHRVGPKIETLGPFRKGKDSESGVRGIGILPDNSPNLLVVVLSSRHRPCPLNTLRTVGKGTRRGRELDVESQRDHWGGADGPVLPTRTGKGVRSRG